MKKTITEVKLELELDLLKPQFEDATSIIKAVQNYLSGKEILNEEEERLIKQIDEFLDPDWKHLNCPAYPNCDMFPEQCLIKNKSLRGKDPIGHKN